jgi:hypothetical protein
MALLMLEKCAEYTGRFFAGNNSCGCRVFDRNGKDAQLCTNV